MESIYGYTWLILSIPRVYKHIVTVDIILYLFLCFGSSYRVYCLIGDGESAEGSVWEALHFASLYKLDNLVLIIDINRLGQSEATSLGHDIQTYHKRIDAFGWDKDQLNMNEFRHKWIDWSGKI